MSIATEAKVAKLEAENENRANESRVLRAGMDALLERMEIIESHFVNNNAVVEGDEISEPKAARNGKLRKSR